MKKFIITACLAVAAISAQAMGTEEFCSNMVEHSEARKQIFLRGMHVSEAVSILDKMKKEDKRMLDDDYNKLKESLYLVWNNKHVSDEIFPKIVYNWCYRTFR